MLCIFYMLYFVIFQLHKVEWYHFQFFFLGYYYYFSNFRINVKYSPVRFQFIIFKWVHFVKQQKLLKLALRCHLIIKVQLFCWGEALGKAIILFWLGQKFWQHSGCTSSKYWYLLLFFDKIFVHLLLSVELANTY